jgi:PKD repeat protein
LRKQRIIRNILLLGLVSYILIGGAQATDYYVSPMGTGNGLTIETAGNATLLVKNLQAGDTMYFLPGTYQGTKIRFSPLGNVSNPIRFLKYNDTVFLDGINNVLDSTNIAFQLSNPNGTIIDGIILKNYTYGIYLDKNASNCIFKNISTVNNSRSIYMCTDGKLTAYNMTIDNINISQARDEAIYSPYGVSNYTTIKNLYMQDGGSAAYGIKMSFAHNLTIKDCNFWHEGGGDPVKIGAYSQDVVIDNVTADDEGYSGHCISLQASDPGQWLENVTVQNCVLLHPAHGGVDIQNTARNVTVLNTTVYGYGSLTPGAISTVNTLGSSLVVRNCTVHDVSRGMSLSKPNAEIWDCNIYNITQYPIYINNKSVSVHNCNLLTTSASDIAIRIDGLGDNYLIENSTTNENNIIQALIGSGTIRDMNNNLYRVTSGTTTNLSIEYTDGRVFTLPAISGITEPIYTTSGAVGVYNSTRPTTFAITVHNFSVLPSSGNVTVSINPPSSELLNITVNSTTKNSILFTMWSLTPRQIYEIKRDGIPVANRIADSDGEISWTNCEWSETTYTIEKVSTSLDIFPTSIAGSNQTVPFGSTVNFNGSESTGGNIISYEWDFDASNGIQQDAIGAIVNHTYETAGVYTVTLKVTDANGTTDSDTCLVTVLEESRATKVYIFLPNVSLPGKTFTVGLLIDPSTPISGTQLDFVFNSSKASVNNVTEGNLLKQSGANTLFSSGTTNNSAGTVKNIYGFILGTSNVSTPGTMATVNLTAGSKTGIAEFSLSNVLISDADSKSVPYTVTNATVLIDTAPVMSSICCPKSVDEKSTLTFKVSAKDADCDRLTLSASGLPEGASFNKTSGNFTWTPTVGQAGVYTMTFEVSDGYLTDSENVTITVNKLNNLPVINSFKPLSGSSFSEGERIEISVNASDADGQSLNYSIRIDGATCSTDTGYVWETDYSSSGNHTIEVVVSDGTDEVKEQHMIYISECRPRWDVNEDGVVNILDVTSVSQRCGTTVSKPYPRYDVNQDGVVNVQDLTLVGHHFGETVK